MTSLKDKLLLLLFFLFPLVAEAVEFRARIFSRQKNKGEANINVLVYETKKFYTTDEDGYFKGEVPAEGEYTFRIIRVTGTQEVKKDVTAQDQVINLYVDKAPPPKGGIVVEGEKEKTVLSRYKVRQDEIKRMPGTLGEALRGLETLPGINAPPFGGGEIVIRGANPSTNTYVVDDLPILYPFHLLGLNSVINNDLIKSIDVYTGAYPARFFNATGGVIEIELLDKVQKPQGLFSASLFSTTGSYQTPTFDGKGYMMVAGRVSYLENTIGLTGAVPAGIRLPQYHDSQVKLVHNFDSKHQLAFYSLTSKDGFAARVIPTPQSDPTREANVFFNGANIAIGRGFNTHALRYTYTPTNQVSHRFTLIHFDPFDVVNGQLGTISVNRTNRPRYWSLRQDTIWDYANWLKFEFGGEFRALSYSLNGRQPVLSDPTNPSPNPYDTNNPAFTSIPLDDKAKTNYSYYYASAKIQIGNFRFEPGTRYDYIGLNKQGVWGPRGTASYRFENVFKGLTLFGGAGQYFHFPPNGSQWSQKSGNTNLAWEQADKYGGGADLQVTQEYSIKGELFKQEFKNSIVSDAYTSNFAGQNPDDRFLINQPIVYNRALRFTNRGTGYAHGYELFLKKTNRPNSRDWFGWISYTWSQTFRNNNLYTRDPFNPPPTLTGPEARVLYEYFNNSRRTFYDFDQTHIVNVVYGWRMSEDIQIGARWQYRTSYPYTPVIGDDGGQFRNPSTGQTFFNEIQSPLINSARLKPYHRLDIRIDKFYNYEWGYMNLFFEVINTYIRRNVVGQQFDNSFPFSATNPSPQFDFSVLQTPGGTIFPLFNLGLEARF